MTDPSLNSIVRRRAQGAVLPDTSQHMISRSVFAAMALAENKRLSRVHTAAIHSLSIDATQHRYLLSAGADTSIQMFDLGSSGQTESVQRVYAGSGHSSIISSVEWYPVDNGMFSSASLDHTLKIWDAATMAEASQFDFECPIYCQKMSPTGTHTLVAAASESPYIRLCDLRSGAFAQSLLAHQSGSAAVAWSPVQPYMLASGGADGKLRLWDIRQTGSHVCDLGSNQISACAHSKDVSGLLFVEDGQRLVSSGLDYFAKVWNIASPQEHVVEIQISNNSKVGSNSAASIKSIEMALTTTADGTANTEILFIPCGTSRSVLAVDMCTGEKLAQLDAHFAPALCAAWRPNCVELYTGGADSNIIPWTVCEALSRIQSELRTDSWSDSEHDNDEAI